MHMSSSTDVPHSRPNDVGSGTGAATMETGGGVIEIQLKRKKYFPPIEQRGFEPLMATPLDPPAPLRDSRDNANLQ